MGIKVCTDGIPQAFHSNGKWLLSGGQDTMVCLVSPSHWQNRVHAYRMRLQWSVPDNLEKSAGSDKPTQVYYPHFASIDIHSDYVDWYHHSTFQLDKLSC